MTWRAHPTTAKNQPNPKTAYCYETSPGHHFLRLGGAASAILLATSLSSSAATTIFADNFDAVDATVGTALNGRTTTTGGGTWLANSIATVSGDGYATATITQGSAQLAYDFEVNKTYTLSLDVVSQPGTSGAWVHLGFSQTAITAPGSGAANDRFTNIGSVAWMYNLNSDLVTGFEGPSTGGQFFTNATVPNGSHTLSTVLDTTGDGSSFTANFLSNGTSISGGAQLVDAVTVAALNYAHWGIYGGATGVGSQVDNFKLEVIPEPSAALLGGIGALALLRRRRI